MRVVTQAIVVCVACVLHAAPLPSQQAPRAVERGDRVGEERRAESVERHGITWRFDAPHVVGTFVNGDPWVKGPVNIVEILPKSVEVGGRVRHGSMLDPDPSTMSHGYDTTLFTDDGTFYRAALNVAFGVTRERPLRLRGTCSLLSVQSQEEAKALPGLLTAAVLTCVEQAPAPDAFRPPYVRGDKKMSHRVVDLDFRVLRKLKPAVGAPDIDEVARAFERVWLDHFPEWPVRYAHPKDNMPDYGRDIAGLVGTAALLLNLDLPDAKKRDLLVRMVQLGIDLHGCLRSGCRWPGLGGHGHGRKMPILFAGAVLHDEAMLAIGKDYGIGPRPGAAKNSFFGEDTQTFFVAETSPGVWNGGHGGYTKEHDGLPEWGFEHADNPASDRSSWTENPYRRCCTANAWLGQALAARVMGLQDAWHHPAFFDYIDRYQQVKHEEAWLRAWVPWHAAMWDTYRKKY